MSKGTQITFFGRRSRSGLGMVGPHYYARHIRNIQSQRGRLSYQPVKFSMNPTANIRAFNRAYPRNQEFVQATTTKGSYLWGWRDDSARHASLHHSGFLKAGLSIPLPSLKYKRKTGNFYVTKNRAYRRALADVKRGRQPSGRIGIHAFTTQGTRRSMSSVMKRTDPTFASERHSKDVMTNARNNHAIGMRSGPQLTRAQRQAIARKRRRVKGRFA